MDIQAEKIHLAKMLLDTENIEIIDTIKKILRMKDIMVNKYVQKQTITLN